MRRGLGLLVLIAAVGLGFFLRPRPAAVIHGRIPPMTVEDQGEQHVYGWTDARGRSRSLSLLRNDRKDATGNYGGYIRRYQYFAGDQLRSCTGSSDEDPGFGFLVNHYNDAKNENRWITSLNFPGSWSQPLRGAHHAIHEYTWKMNIEGEPVDATVHWFIADGRDHPVFSVIYDLSRARPDAIKADSRSPYGDIGWDGDKRSLVGGVAWGDRYKFRSLGDLSRNSAWDYRERNQIPYVQMWSQSVDAEMGLVQTQTWEQQDAGGYWLYRSWGEKSDGPMPENWNWTYQLNQYQLEADPTSKRLAWGMNYGALGQRAYRAYGDDRQASGYPLQRYAVFVVLGEHRAGAVLRQVGEMERVQAVEGNVVWDPRYGVWDGRRGDLEFLVKEGVIHNPIFHLRGTEAIQGIQQDGKRLAADEDYLLSRGDDGWWVTLVGDFSGETRFSIQ